MPSSKKSTLKPPKSRPASTSAISQPAVGETLPVLSSFSPDGNHFALVTLAVDKHRLRVFNSVSGRAVAEHTIQSGRVGSLIWTTTNFGKEDEESGKKRKKRKTDGEAGEEASVEVEVIVFGLSDGMIQFFSPSHAKIVKTLSHSTSTSLILALARTPKTTTSSSLLWSSSADSSVHLWNVQNQTILRTWKNDDRIAYTSLSMQPSSLSSSESEEDETSSFLAAHHHIRLLSTSLSSSHDSTSTSSKPTQLSSFTGHASNINRLRWINTTYFLSSADIDRFVYLWDAQNASASNEKPTASISLDSDVRTLEVHGGHSDTASTSESNSSPAEEAKRTLLALSTSGKLIFVPIPEEFPTGKGTADKPSGIHTLLPRTTLASSIPSKGKTDAPIVDISTESGTEDSIRVVRLVNGIKPVFDVVRFLDDKGDYITNLSLDPISDLANSENLQSTSAPNKRYTEPSSIGVGSGFDPDHAHNIEDSAAQREIDGSLQVDLAELSLGQRLAALPDAEMPGSSGSSSDEEEGTASTKKLSKNSKSKSKKASSTPTTIPASSLTRTLIQALHSSDTRLLELCLSHSDPSLIRNTVRKLPPQLAIPLINACVERLGRGARAANMKGRGGGASAQRGIGLVAWIKEVLGVHMGHLMTIPDVVARLAGLHATLTARMGLYESLLGLSGRLDTVLSQVEYRASTAPSSMNVKGSKGKEAIVKRYIEGEDESSSSSDEDAEMDVEVEVGGGSDEEGSVEDVELGGDSDEEDSAEESEEEDSEEDSEGDHGFIDDEAEEDEYSEEEDESD
ncbi:WD40-repeat-containing domain protein [Crepidotus variabilis]|uniref:WD40-repeat-containing domain protein n=1 Tax=Crepidotus variabilis TaxID=179855 RepID=A0A9P6E7T5_9AGAR|nr:WD40-repeat-containing domain protein [Crepidotus variabilis]